MTVAPRLIARIALFSATVYVLSWGTSFLPNVNLAFLISFLAGYLWGLVPGAMVGVIGMWLWTTFNPFGPAALPVALAQIAGLGGSGIVGGIVPRQESIPSRGRLIVFSIICSLVFYLPVTLVDAWVFQPFWPRVIGALPYVGLSLVANAVIFPLLFPAAVRINERGKADRR